MPLQIFHGSADDFVRPAHSEVLYAAAAEPKALWLVPGADHGTDEIVMHPEFGARLAPFVDGVCAGRRAQPTGGGTCCCQYWSC